MSVADLIALAGAEAVKLSRGPELSNIGLGRQDTTTEDPENRIPAETATAKETKESFARMGYGTFRCSLSLF